VGADYKPKFGFVVVQKRINTRILWKRARTPLAVDNPRPGTVVDFDVSQQWNREPL